MSMPSIVTPENPISFDQAVIDIIESVALEETALSHILNAEGEKIQKIVAIEEATTDELLSVNASVKDMICAITELESVLQMKLGLVEKYIECHSCE